MLNSCAYPTLEADHIIPSEEYSHVFVPLPTATHNEPFHEIALHFSENRAFPERDGIQLIPSTEYAILLSPCPPANQIEPFQATTLH